MRRAASSPKPPDGRDAADVRQRPAPGPAISSCGLPASRCRGAFHLRWQGSRWLSTALPGNACALLPYPYLRRQTWGHAVSRQLGALGHGQTLHATSGGQHVSQQGGPESLGWWRDVGHGTAKEAAQREPAEAVWGCFTQPVAFSTAYGRPCVLQHSHASCCRRHLVTAADACKVRPTAALLVPWPTLASRRVGAARNLPCVRCGPSAPGVHARHMSKQPVRAGDAVCCHHLWSATPLNPACGRRRKAMHMW